ncbi:hypothetical protein [Paractinoplanes brasiliensis]|uniref:Uncharacterized protein n=1 Tax=Paractinoplanes brasiliensis TaxID=52695 RepID=A0A4R6JK61_9ACTN|nr:hypothetical protein [Actinoplanes brasiliensis]TDO36459.1 hypothetical protein C8E87_0029 [Actinoplanes brasiliensis]
MIIQGADEAVAGIAGGSTVLVGGSGSSTRWAREAWGLSDG